MSEIIPRNVILGKVEMHIVRRAALQRRMGEKGFSAALRLIIREWAEDRGQLPRSVGKSNTAARPGRLHPGEGKGLLARWLHAFRVDRLRGGGVGEEEPPDEPDTEQEAR